ncbi:MAG TPA: hypothetical protein VLT45_31235 [Kofleriaceae bacterium]|nr:hypothetical protein [Kofleriaceae bacterium]
MWIDGARIELRQLLAQGGEAEVYDLGDGRVVKWWKPADHPDFVGNAVAQAAAAKRIAEGGARLAALPARLRDVGSVVTPIGLARSRTKQVIGYVMAKVAGEPLFSLGESRWRRAHAVDVRGVLLALHDALAALHRAGVVVGDCNDLNVRVDGTRVHLIDVDSYQLPGFACSMFSERFVDPRLCDAGQLVPVRPHDEASDWFAFAAMALRSLVLVGPWGGVARGLASLAARALQRKSVLAPDVTYPRTARPLATLPDGLVHLFRAIFERDERGVFPRSALEQLRIVTCAACGEEHARVRCPACAVVVPPVAVHGRLRWQPIAVPATPARRVFLDGDALWRTTALGPERIGSVLAGQTRVWCGDALGIGFYRASGYARGFVFHPERGRLDDSLAMPRLRGQLVAAHATLAADRAYLWLTLADAGRLATTALVVDAHARVLACEALDAPWAAGVAGACASGPHLFVPTDDGIVRVEVVGGALVQTRSFPETAPLVTAGDRLLLHATGLDVVRARDAIRLQLT